jgi:serine/threonine-protein kinase
MGEVFRAWDPNLRGFCALKLLGPGASDEHRARFEREATLTSAIVHPNTVRAYDCGCTDDGTRYYAMELVEGETLEELVRQEGAQPASRVLGILRQLCGALRGVHEAGLVHRDVKPDNVMLSRVCGEDRIKLVDFGLLQHLAVQEDDDLGTGSFLGTPLYMSPEAITAPSSVDVRADLYGLGALAYFLLTGAPVFRGTNVIDVCTQHLYAVPERFADDRELDRKLEQIVLDCLAKDPAARPASAQELLDRLAHCERPFEVTPPVRSRKAARVREPSGARRSVFLTGSMPDSELTRVAAQVPREAA